MVGVVVNPNALGVRRDPSIARRLREVLGDDGEVFETHTPVELRAAVDALADRGCDLVCICGGDGTNLSTISRLIERMGEDRLPRLAILRGGTVNTVAKNLGIRGTPVEMLARIVARVRAGEPLDDVGQDLIAVNGMHGFLFAAGMGARFLEAYYGAPAQGVAAAGALAARTIASSLLQGSYARWLFHPVEIELHADGERVPIERARLVVISTVRDVGIGMRVAWRAGTTPGRFHLVASALPTRAMALQLHKVVAGRRLASDGPTHADRLAARVELRFAGPQSFTLDGELFRGDHVTVGIGPRVRIVIP
jgi:diacylglycerol kinase family enzyme